MTRSVTQSHLKVSVEVGPLLMLRSNVPPLFRKIASLEEPRVILDFTKVEFMSRSFADEYLAAKAASGKTIEERAVPPAIRRMLGIVRRQQTAAGSGNDAAQFSRQRSRVATL